ncbi:MAG: TRAP transporter large permease [Oceanipulchritudo sp.]
MDVQVFILLLSFVTLLFLNVPIAVCLGIATLLTIFSLGSVPADYIFSQRMANGIASFPLLAIPFFILSGILMGEGGMARRLMDFAQILVGGFRAGLCYVNTLTCMLFGAVSGSAAAAVSSIGGFMIPEMTRKGYGRDFSVALTTTSATTGLLIPPSNIMIVYAVVAGNVSVAGLFIAGIIPGIVIGLLLMGTAYLMMRRHPVEKVERNVSKVDVVISFLHAVPSLFLIILVLGGILGGVFSATEASAVAVVYAWFIGGIVYGEVKFSQLPSLLLRAGKMTAVVMFLIGASSAMSWVLAYENIPQAVSEALLAISENKYVTFLIINILILVVGTFMDMTPAVLIFTPIFLPAVMSMGIDPIHFGIWLIANLCIGLCTPPVGTCLFVGCGVGRTSLAKVIPPLLPLFGAMVLGLLLITYIPELSLWLPRLLGF